jgi:hypothetical protein
MEQIKDTKKYWFRRKRYGWGWGLPTAWQGWVVLVVYFVAVIANFKAMDPNSQPESDFLKGYLPRFFLLTIALLIICWKKGEKPKWSWGK